MDAIEFVKERQRICNSYQCQECPFNKEGCGFRDCEAESLVKRVEKWSRENPIITKAEKFKEIFGVYPTNFDGSDYVCPISIGFKEVKCQHSCYVCKENFWNTEYKEPKNGKME